jgi:hypothetical protein
MVYFPGFALTMILSPIRNKCSCNITNTYFPIEESITLDQNILLVALQSRRKDMVFLTSGVSNLHH